MKRFLFSTLVLVAACTKATPDPGVTKEPTTQATPTVAPSAPPAAAAPSSTSTMPSGELDPQFVADVKTAFAEYKQWGRVDDEMRWAPWLCRMPMPATPHMSEAAEGGHARKLYSLFAKDHSAYIGLGHPDTRPSKEKKSQIIAKESWVPELVTEKPDPRRPGFGPYDYEKPDGGIGVDIEGINADHFRRYAHDGDKLYRAATLAGVYFMIQKDAKTPGTDHGWIYATITPKGEVTSAGRVASCMGCHESAKHDRLFGRAATKY